MCRCKKNSRRISNLVLKLKMFWSRYCWPWTKPRSFTWQDSLSALEKRFQHLSVDLCLCLLCRHQLSIFYQSPFNRLLTPLSPQLKTRFWSWTFQRRSSVGNSQTSCWGSRGRWIVMELFALQGKLFISPKKAKAKRLQNFWNFLFKYTFSQAGQPSNR